MEAYKAAGSVRKVRRKEFAEWRRWLRACDQVDVYAEGVGFVRVTKKTARKLIREKGTLLIARNIPELGLLFLEPCPF